MQNNRINPRIDFHLPVEIKGHRGPHTIRDFSVGGVLIETKDASHFKPGDEIDVIIALPLEKSPIQVKFRVTRVTSKGIGVQFVNLAPKDAMALEWCFHVFKHTIPLAGT